MQGPDQEAREVVLISFLYSGLKWCFSGTGDSCGMDNLPSLGLKAKKWTWYCDFRSPPPLALSRICKSGFPSCPDAIIVGGG